MKHYFLLGLLLIWLGSFPLVGNADVVDTDIMYTYESLSEDLAELSRLYPEFVSYQPLTETQYGRKVWAVKVGNGEKSILINGAHHAREWMTSTVLMKMIETYADAYKSDRTVGDLSPKILNDVAIWFVPMVNPDGVTLQQCGLSAYPSHLHSRLIDMNEGSLNFKRWKANLNGIDLNRQYAANWDNLKGVSAEPSYQYYKGREPFEAREVKALVTLTRDLMPEITVSYHSSGNVLFWGFHQWGLTHTTNFAEDYYDIAEKVAEITGYELEEPKSHQQGGGYTDWYIEEFEKPGLTIEIGNEIEENSLPLDESSSIWERNKEIGLFLAIKAYERSLGQ